MKQKSNLPISPGRPREEGPCSPSGRSKVIITPDVYRLLIDVLAPVHVTHKSDHADLIKNVVLEEIRGKINAIYSSSGYRS